MDTKVRFPPGIIRDEIFKAFVAAGGIASIKEIHDLVEHKIGVVSRSSIQSYVTNNCPYVFERIRRGHYKIAGYSGNSKISGSTFSNFDYLESKLFLGNCFDVINAMEDNSIEAVVTDPPYGLVEFSNSELSKLKNGKGGVWRIPPSFDGVIRSPLPRFTTLSETDLENLSSFFLEFSRKIRRVLVPGGHMIVASNPLVSHILSSAFSASGFENRGTIIRKVITMRGGDRPKNAHKEFHDVSMMPRSSWEPWVLVRKPMEGTAKDNLRKWKTGGLRRISKDRPFFDLIVSHPTQKNEKKLANHPSLKPQSFMRQIVRASLPLGYGTVLDPFCGSGSTLAACNAIGYKSIGIEQSEEYFDLAKAAIPKLTRFEIKGDLNKPNSF